MCDAIRRSARMRKKRERAYCRSAARTGKRERLQASQAVLKLALKLLRELESPNQISGLSMNPLFYNGVQIVVVSALSAALSEALGIDLKVWKLVKLK